MRRTSPLQNCRAINNPQNTRTHRYGCCCTHPGHHTKKQKPQHTMQAHMKSSFRKLSDWQAYGCTPSKQHTCNMSLRRGCLHTTTDAHVETAKDFMPTMVETHTLLYCAKPPSSQTTHLPITTTTTATCGVNRPIYIYP